LQTLTMKLPIKVFLWRFKSYGIFHFIHLQNNPSFFKCLNSTVPVLYSAISGEVYNTKFPRHGIHLLSYLLHLSQIQAFSNSNNGTALIVSCCYSQWKVTQKRVLHFNVAPSLSYANKEQKYDCLTQSRVTQHKELINSNTVRQWVTCKVQFNWIQEHKHVQHISLGCACREFYFSSVFTGRYILSTQTGHYFYSPTNYRK
jgi:hypothetical protein